MDENDDRCYGHSRNSHKFMHVMPHRKNKIQEGKFNDPEVIINNNIPFKIHHDLTILHTVCKYCIFSRSRVLISNYSCM